MVFTASCELLAGSCQDPSKDRSDGTISGLRPPNSNSVQIGSSETTPSADSDQLGRLYQPQTARHHHVTAGGGGDDVTQVVQNAGA